MLILERAALTSGSTFHSAGLVGQLRADPTLTRMNTYSVELHRKLERTEHAPGWVECGGIRLASSPARLEEIRRQLGWARHRGLEVQEISAAQAGELFPLIETDGVLGAAWSPTDGYVDPARLCYALAALARPGGAAIHQRTRVLGIDLKRGRVHRVRTDRGDVDCEAVVNCLLVYYRQELGGLVMGGYERCSAPWNVTAGGVDSVPADFNGKLLAPEWDRFSLIAENAQVRVPALADIGIRTLINGPEAFRPDNEFCLGETAVGGFFVAAGFCAHGIAGAGGIGQVMANWIVDGEPGMDLWHMDIRRFGPHDRSPSYTLARTVESYETYYDIHYPHQHRRCGRPLRTSPAYSWHAAHGAVFGEKSGWERVDYYEPNAVSGDASRRPQGWAVTYTQALSSRGGIMSDVTISPLDDQEFLIVTGTAFGAHDLGWLRDHVRRTGASVRLVDVAGQYACIGLWGPKARDALGR